MHVDTLMHERKILSKQTPKNAISQTSKAQDAMLPLETKLMQDCNGKLQK
jgi:hypothetical protein